MRNLFERCTFDAKAEQRSELYKRILSGEDELWEKYVRLLKEVKQ